jgi:hypothetical protein
MLDPNKKYKVFEILPEFFELPPYRKQEVLKSIQKWTEDELKKIRDTLK